MSTNVVFVHAVSSVASLQMALLTGHTTFPVVNNSNNLVGVISSRYIETLLVNRCFVGSSLMTDLSLSQKLQQKVQLSDGLFFESPRKSGPAALKPIKETLPKQWPNDSYCSDEQSSARSQMQHELNYESECSSQVSFKPKLVQEASINFYQRQSTNEKPSP